MSTSQLTLAIIKDQSCKITFTIINEKECEGKKKPDAIPHLQVIENEV